LEEEALLLLRRVLVLFFEWRARTQRKEERERETALSSFVVLSARPGSARPR
jgi:hypothetical protein